MSNSSSQDLRNGGWGFALFIIILAIVANLGAFTMHKKTYLQPSKAAVAHDAAPAAKAH